MTKLWIPALAMAAVAGGVAYWAKGEPPQPPPVHAEAKGTSFDVAPATSVPEIKKEEPPAPTPVVAKAPEKPAEPAAPRAEAKPAPVEAPAPPAVKPAEKKPDAEDVKPELITFSKLAFRYWPKNKDKDKDARDPFPAQIQAMHGKKVIIDGYMFPVDFEKGKVKSFLLSRAMFGCCFGDTPTMSEIVKVVHADGKPMSFEAVARVTGVLEVGEDFDSDGYVDSIFRIKAESVVAAPGWR